MNKILIAKELAAIARDLNAGPRYEFQPGRNYRDDLERYKAEFDDRARMTRVFDIKDVDRAWEKRNGELFLRACEKLIRSYPHRLKKGRISGPFAPWGTTKVTFGFTAVEAGENAWIEASFNGPDEGWATVFTPVSGGHGSNKNIKFKASSGRFDGVIREIQEILLDKEFGVPYEEPQGEMPADGKPLDLGWANGWRKTPRIVEECVKKHHRTIRKQIRRTETLVTCPECNYVYRYDDSD